MNLIIGSHVSFVKGQQLKGSVEETLSYGANALMLYTGAPQNTNRIPIDNYLTNTGQQLLIANNIDINHIVVHAPYIVNIANNAGDNNQFAIAFLKQELSRIKELGLKYLVLHPGSFVKLTRDEGLDNIVQALDEALSGNYGVTILLETMSGKGTEIGINFSEIKYILDHARYKHLLGVCLDTCHLHDAGYDLSAIDDLLAEIDDSFGLDKIKCIHVNDSKNPRGANKDRHENIGFGHIGFDTLLKVIYHPLLKNIPKILETPYIKSEKGAYPPYKFEIEMIRNKEFNPNLVSDVISYYEN